MLRLIDGWLVGKRTNKTGILFSHLDYLKERLTRSIGSDTKQPSTRFKRRSVPREHRKSLNICAWFKKKKKETLTGMHSHLMQYITPKGGPRSANHVEPNSRTCLPNWHSETYNIFNYWFKNIQVLARLRFGDNLLYWYGDMWVYKELKTVILYNLSLCTTNKIVRKVLYNLQYCTL